MSPLEWEGEETTQVDVPRTMIWIVGLLSVLPFAFNVIGLGLGSGVSPGEAVAPCQLVPFVTLELTGICIAILLAVMAYIHFGITGDIVTPVIGFAILCAAFIDFFSLTSFGSGWMAEGGQHPNLVAFTWIISRSALGVILIGATFFFILSESVKGQKEKQAKVIIMLIATLVAAGLAFLLIRYLDARESLPRAYYPDNLLRRPWDLIPLLLFVLAGAYCLPEFSRTHPSIYAHALILAMIPAGIAELHLIFGNAHPFDTHFHSAYVLKLLVYIVPLAGLILDYRRTYTTAEKLTSAVKNDLLMQEQNEDALSREQGVVQTIFDHLTESVFIKDVSGRYTRLNKAHAERLGLSSPLEATGKTDREFLDEESQRPIEEGEVALLSGKQSRWEGTLNLIQGDRKIALDTLQVPVKDLQGRIVGLLGIGREKK